MKFEAININDLDEIRSLQPEGWPDIVPNIKRYVEYDFCYPVKAVSGGKIKGIGSLNVFENTAWLAHIIVGKTFRNSGIGYGIVEYLLSLLDTFSVNTCLLIATALGFPVYQKAGFRNVGNYTFFQKEKSIKYSVVSKCIMPCPKRNYKDLLALDRKISGEGREPLLQKYLNNAIIYLEENRIQAYYMPNLGEGMLFAENQNAALELMKLKCNKATKVVIPSDNKIAAAFLKESGFCETDAIGIRMMIGKDLDWQPEKMYSRIGGNFG